MNLANFEIQLSFEAAVVLLHVYQKVKIRLN